MPVYSAASVALPAVVASVGLPETDSPQDMRQHSMTDAARAPDIYFFMIYGLSDIFITYLFSLS